MGSNPARAETNSQAQVPCRDIYGKARAPETERQEFNKEKWARRERSERSQMREKDKERGYQGRIKWFKKQIEELKLKIED